MRKTLFKSGALPLMCVALTAMAQERSPFGSPAVQTEVQAGSQASIQANAGQQTWTTPLLLNLSGATVKDESGQQLGQIQHVMVSPQGCVDMAVLSLGGNKLVPIPWQLVEVSAPAAATTTATTGAQRIGMKLNVDRQKLLQAPSFNMNQISQITQQQTIQQVYSFYGIEQTQAGVGASTSQASSVIGAGGSTNATLATPYGGTGAQFSGQTNQVSNQAIGQTNTFSSPAGGSQVIGQTNAFGSQVRTNQYGAGATGTNQFSGSLSGTNQLATQTTNTNLSPTGQTNGYPNRFTPPGSTNTAPPRTGTLPARPTTPAPGATQTNAQPNRFQTTPAPQAQQ